MGEIIIGTTQREWNQVFRTEWSFPAPHVAPLTIYSHITENQSYVTVSEQTIKHMWHRGVKFVKKGLYDNDGHVKCGLRSGVLGSDVLGYIVRLHVNLP